MRMRYPIMIISQGVKSFQDGMYQIQDISSMLAGEYTAPKAGDTIVDVCGAPGGKSINAALKMSEQGIAAG